jgi:hypothetical protein
MKRKLMDELKEGVDALVEQRNLNTETQFYCIEFYAGYADHNTEKVTYRWEELQDPFGNEYRFKDEQTAIHKAMEIAKEGRWGHPIKLRVIRRVIKVESWFIHELDPKDYYVK